MSKNRLFFLVLFFLFLMVDGTHAETITLTSGKVIHAKIVEQANDYIKVDIGGVKLTYYRDTIAQIESDEGNVKPSVQPSASVTVPRYEPIAKSSEPVVERQESLTQNYPTPHRQEDININDYVKVEYGPGEDLTNLVVDPSHALNALGLKIDRESGGLAADFSNPNGSADGASWGSLGQAVKITIVVMCVLGVALYIIRQRMP